MYVFVYGKRNECELHYKVKQQKTEQAEVLQRQLKILIARLEKTYKNIGYVEFSLGYMSDDFISDRHTLRVKFEYFIR